MGAKTVVEAHAWRVWPARLPVMQALYVPCWVSVNGRLQVPLPACGQVPPPNADTLMLADVQPDQDADTVTVWPGWARFGVTVMASVGAGRTVRVCEVLEDAP